jgi:DNA-directed RNA polymerase specialized sigma24 family protein
LVIARYAVVVRSLAAPIYHLALRMTLRADDAAVIVRETFVRAYRHLRCSGAESLTSDDVALEVQRAAVVVAQEQQRAREQLTFEELDALIRGDPTQSGIVDHLTDPQRNRLLWELKQGCLTAVVNCLPPGERIAFILSDLLTHGTDQVAAALQITPSAMRVRVSRARKKVTAYLAPRCEHVDPRNPCHCPSRLGVALSRGFISDVRGKQVSLRTRPFDEPPQHDPLAIFRTLPAPEPPSEMLEELERDLADGLWD